MNPFFRFSTSHFFRASSSKQGQRVQRSEWGLEPFLQRDRVVRLGMWGELVGDGLLEEREEVVEFLWHQSLDPLFTQDFSFQRPVDVVQGQLERLDGAIHPLRVLQQATVRTRSYR